MRSFLSLLLVLFCLFNFIVCAVPENPAELAKELEQCEKCDREHVEEACKRCEAARAIEQAEQREELRKQGLLKQAPPPPKPQEKPKEEEIKQQPSQTVTIGIAPRLSIPLQGAPSSTPSNVNVRVNVLNLLSGRRKKEKLEKIKEKIVLQLQPTQMIEAPMVQQGKSHLPQQQFMLGVQDPPLVQPETQPELNPTPTTPDSYTKLNPMNSPSESPSPISEFNNPLEMNSVSAERIASGRYQTLIQANVPAVHNTFQTIEAAPIMQAEQSQTQPIQTYYALPNNPRFQQTQQ